jgi:hypothetical protein
LASLFLSLVLSITVLVSRIGDDYDP